MNIVVSYYKHQRPQTNRKVGLWNKVKHHVKVILLLKGHPLDAKIFVDVVSNTRHPLAELPCGQGGPWPPFLYENPTSYSKYA
jgi:hypothetical protein